MDAIAYIADEGGRMKKIFLAIATTLFLIGVAFLISVLQAQTTPPALAQGQQACPLKSNEAQRAAAAFSKMNVVLQHPRCANCHGNFSDAVNDLTAKHPGGKNPLDNFGQPILACSQCHDAGGIEWQLAPIQMHFVSKNDTQVCKRFRTEGNGINFLNHLAGDKLVLLGFEGKKGHKTGTTTESPPISHDDFLKLAEEWVAAVYKTTDQQIWRQPFPGGDDSTCGCDPNNSQAAFNVDEQLLKAMDALKNNLTECNSKKFLECVSVEKSGWRVTGFLARELAGFGSERTDIGVSGNTSSADAQRAFQIHAQSYSKPPGGTIESFASETFDAVSGVKNSGVLQVWLDPFFDGNKQAGRAFGHLICGNLNTDFKMFLTGDLQGGQSLVDRTRAQLKTLMQQTGGTFVGVGACIPEQIASTPGVPAPAPLLGTITKIERGLEVKILRAGKDFRGQWEEDDLAGKPLNFGDVFCFKGLGALTITWWDGSIVTLSEGKGSVIIEHCLEVGVKTPTARTSQNPFLKVLSTLGKAIRVRVTGKDEIPSIAELEDFNVSVTVKGTTYILGNDPATGASIVCAEEGVVHLTPRNASLAPLELQAGNQVQITANAIGAITAGCTLPAVTSIAQPARNAARMTIQAARRFVFAGETIRVPVWLIKSNNLANLNFSIAYDPKIIQPVGDSIKGNLLDNALFKANPNTAGQILFGIAQTQGISNDVGTLVEIPLRVVGKPGDVSPLLLNVTTINDPNGGDLEIDRLAGEIVIVNEDGTLPGGGNGTGGGGTGGGAGGGGGGAGGGGAGGGGVGGIQNGDCDGSGALNELDALCALEMSVGIRAEKSFADMDASGLPITSRDAVIILQRAVGQ